MKTIEQLEQEIIDFRLAVAERRCPADVALYRIRKAIAEINELKEDEKEEDV